MALFLAPGVVGEDNHWCVVSSYLQIVGTVRARTTAFTSADSLTISSRELSLCNTMMHPPQRRKSRDLLFLLSLQGPRPCLVTSGSPDSSSTAQARILFALSHLEIQRFTSFPNHVKPVQPLLPTQDKGDGKKHIRPTWGSSKPRAASLGCGGLGHVPAVKHPSF